jgi:hypothetical protein
MQLLTLLLHLHTQQAHPFPPSCQQRQQSLQRLSLLASCPQRQQSLQKQQSPRGQHTQQAHPFPPSSPPRQLQRQQSLPRLLQCPPLQSSLQLLLL